MKSAVSNTEEVLRGEDVSKALNSIKRTIRLSSAASSPHFLVLGAHTGSLYFFDRTTLRFLQLAVFEDLQEPISHVSFSPDEKMLAFATGHPHRHIYITQIPIKARRRKDLVCISDHKSEIRHLHWGIARSGPSTNNNNNNAPPPSNPNPSPATVQLFLFSGDDSGAVMRTVVNGWHQSGPSSSSSSSLLPPSSSSSFNLTSVTTEMLYQADSRVYQLSYETEVNQLIVSSSTCTALLDFTRSQALKVGTKPRSGPFGSSFYVVASSGSSSSSSSNPPSSQTDNGISILAARPGNRIWVASPANASKVTQTLNFQTSLSTTSPAPLFDSPALSLDTIAKEDLNFQKLIPLDGWALLTWNTTNLFFVDVLSLKIIQWYHLGPKSHGYIADVTTSNSHVYVLYHKFEDGLIGSTNQSSSPAPSSVTTTSSAHSSAHSSGHHSSSTTHHSTLSSSGDAHSTPDDLSLAHASSSIEPMLAHLSVDWNGMLQWCLNAGDWGRASLVLSSKHLTSLPLLLSIAPFLTKNAVDKNIANELGKLAKSQIDRLEKESEEVIPKTPSSSTLHSKSTTLPSNTANQSESTVISSNQSASAAVNTDWSEFTQMPSSDTNTAITIATTANTNSTSKSKIDNGEDSSSKSSFEITSSSDPLPSTSTETLPSTSVEPLPAVSDVFDFGSSTAPAKEEPQQEGNAIQTLESPLTIPTATSDANSASIASETHDATPIATHKQDQTREEPPKREEEFIVPSSPSIPSSFAHSHDNASPVSSPSVPHALLAAEDCSSPALGDSSFMEDTTSSSLSAATIEPPSSPTPPLASASAARRKKKPRAVDIAAPSAKPIPSPSLSPLLSNTPTNGRNDASPPVSHHHTPTNPPHNPNPTLISNPKSSFPSSPSLPDILSAIPDVFSGTTSKASSPASTPSTTPLGSLPETRVLNESFPPVATTPSTTTSTTTSTAATTTTTSTTSPHTVTQWGSSNASLGMESTNPSSFTPSSTIGDAPALPMLSSPSHASSSPLPLTEGGVDALEGENSMPLSIPPSTTSSATITASASATTTSSASATITSASTTKSSLSSSTSSIPKPSSSSSSTTTTTTTTGSTTTAELKQLGRDFKNKAKEGFKSFLSSLPSSTATNASSSSTNTTTPNSSSNTALTTSNASSEVHNHHIESTAPPLPPFTSSLPATDLINDEKVSIPNDNLTKSVMQRLEYYKAMKGREAMTEAWIWPSLSRWLSRAKSSLDRLKIDQSLNSTSSQSSTLNPSPSNSISNSSLPFHPSITEILTACFEYQVDSSSLSSSSSSTSSSMSAAEWSEKDALSFLSLFRPHLRISDVLSIANTHDWHKVTEYILEKEEEDYVSWKKSAESEEEKSLPSSIHSSNNPSNNSSSLSNPSPQSIARFTERLEVDEAIAKDNKSLALRLVTSRNDLALFLSYLPSMLSSLPKETLMACASLYPMVKPKHLRSLITSGSNLAIELGYYKALLERSKEARRDEEVTTKWLDLALESLLHPIADKLWIPPQSDQDESNSSTSSDLSKQEDEGEKSSFTSEINQRPLPGSLRLLQGDSFSSIWSALKDTEEYRFDKKKVLKVCAKRGFHSATIFFLKELGRWAEAIDLAIMIDDRETFEKEVVMKRGRIAGAEEWTRIVFQSAHVHNYLADSDKRPEISADMIVKAMTKDIGARETVNFLTATHPTSEASSSIDTFLYALSAHVFQTLLREGEKGDERKRVVEKALKSVDAYLFSKKTPFYGAQISNVESIEKNAALTLASQGQGMAFSPSEQKMSSTPSSSPAPPVNPLSNVPFFTRVETARGGSEYNPSFVFSDSASSSSVAVASSSSATTSSTSQSTGKRSSSLPSSSSTSSVSSPTISSSPAIFFGETAPHWGVRTHFSASTPCPRCRLPLLDPRAGKLALFPDCPHAFHEMCVDEDACPECLFSSLSSLASLASPPSSLATLS